VIFGYRQVVGLPAFPFGPEDVPISAKTILLSVCLHDQAMRRHHPRFAKRFRIIDVVLTVCFIFALASLFGCPAYAYVDPGSGILACQAARSSLVPYITFAYRSGVCSDRIASRKQTARRLPR
jgi:hypothetical protein